VRAGQSSTTYSDLPSNSPSNSDLESEVVSTRYQPRTIWVRVTTTRRSVTALLPCQFACISLADIPDGIRVDALSPYVCHIQSEGRWCIRYRATGSCNTVCVPVPQCRASRSSAMTG
jgi:hypothetical protein